MVNIIHDCINIYLGFTALILAADAGFLVVVKHLLRQGSSVQEKTNEGRINIQLILVLTICFTEGGSSLANF